MSTFFVMLLLASVIGLIIGLINPSLFKIIFRKNSNRKTIGLIFGFLILASFILIGVTAPDVPAKPKPTATIPSSIVLKSAETSTKTQLLGVTKIVDGDTIDVETIGRVRLIGIDTPETVNKDTVIQCFGQAATEKANEILADKKVSLENDLTSGDKDEYGRSLRYVFLEDGTNFNKFMISEGFAHEYSYKGISYKYQAEFKEAEKQAKNTGKGFWAASTCNGDTTKAAVMPTSTITPSIQGVSQTNIQPAPTQAPVIVPAPAPTSAVSVSAQSGGGVVKKSSTGICHAPGTTYYDRTKSFVSFDSIEACLASGGRLPKR